MGVGGVAALRSSPGTRPGGSAPLTVLGVQRDPRERREAVDQLDQVVVRAGAADRARQVADGRLARRAANTRASFEERPEPRRHRLGGVDQRVDVVERGAQVHERGVRAPQERRQPLDRLAPGRACWLPSAPKVVLRFATTPVRSSAALGEGVHERRRVDQEAPRAAARRASARSNRRAAGRQRRVEVVDAAAQLRARGRAAVTAWPLITSCSELRVLGSNRAKTSSSSTAVLVWSAPMRPPSSISLPSVGAELEVDVAVGDPRQRGRLDHRLGAVAQRRVVVVDGERDLGSPVVRVTSMSSTVPTATPATRTSLPLTSCPAFSNSAVTVVAAAAREQDESDEDRGHDHAGRRPRRARQASLRPSRAVRPLRRSSTPLSSLRVTAAVYDSSGKSAWSLTSLSASSSAGTESRTIPQPA